ncbi:MAG: K(+)-insensitive pyrophosphate-energized proton pump [Candidatus Woesebacteria bacterium GW2011_GWA2_40_7b]|uniref:K(+)-insensitive pyrophosphate-energized proton pump n=1 Tax=Candidatus Woesebacteria bacterium GW2011_GWA2_40_7b TaxID=1618563 RepID=A0A0G0W5Y1_9BACT|nr:MAG: K(+)-insensitive pyrophosphate-energized proton pump [Candidatus Woesebacteria bacterium GW2011_GWA2_40_7b]
MFIPMNELSNIEQLMLKGVIGVALISLVYAFWLWRATIAWDKGSEKMQAVWRAIKRGAEGYLKRQLKTILLVLIPLSVILFLSVYVVPPSKEAVERFGQNAVIIVAIGRTVAFIIGASFSILVGQLGMRVAIESNIRVTAQAVKENYNNALTVAYRGGTFTGMLTDGLGLLGGTAIFMIFV